MNLTKQLELERKQQAEAEEMRAWHRFTLANPQWKYEAAKMAFFEFIHPEPVTFELLVKAGQYISCQVGSLSKGEIQRAILGDEQSWQQRRREYNQRVKAMTPAVLRSERSKLDEEAATLNQELEEIQARKVGRIVPEKFRDVGLTAEQIKAMPKEQLRKLLYHSNGEPKEDVIRAVNAILNSAR